ncbi:hypothetical protein K227x_42370 [Rubripirellula lacrimiformis]|uniref:DUF2059 domain-containing protein n=2 Tax=Rubripirellula lacrimiformis TaxID=1930273 RepID=A0A517NFC3_9BACT|nr:hypothetical protein K227x_42370 [Rubripirellula lacrimiformis]
MKIRVLSVLCIAMAMGTFSFAQDAAPTKVADDSAVVAEDSHSAAIEKFLSVMKMEETTRKTIDQMLAMQVQQNPQMGAFTDVMKSFLQKHLAFAVIKGDLIKLYRDNFTEAEIKELTAFYETPVGRKAAEKLPMLAAAGAQIGGQRVQANMAELQAAMAKREAEMRAASQEAAQGTADPAK